MNHKQTRCRYGTTRRRFLVSADKDTEDHILEAQSRLSKLTGIKPSLSVAIAYLVKEGHKATHVNQ